MIRRFALLLLIVAVPATAQIYKYTDANGNTAYSNQPPDGTTSQALQLPPLNSVGLQAPSPATSAPAAAPASAATPAASIGNTPAPASQAAYSVLELTDIPSDEALRANNGTFAVGVRIQPRLQPGHRLRLLLDGNAYGQPSNVPLLQLTHIDRGEHSLAVQVVAGDSVVQQSSTLTFTVQRVHQP